MAMSASTAQRAAVILILSNVIGFVLCDFDLVLLHNNDIHGRFEETERNSGTCQDKSKKTCVGGIARTAHVVRKYRMAAESKTGPEVLYLNAGDTFIGTIWYTVHTWNISSTFMNLLKPDVQCFGNHEFDKGPDELVQYLSVLTYPTVVCNLDLSLEPKLKELVRNYVVIEKAGVKIGIIGYLTPETSKISSPRGTAFLDELEEVNKQAEILKASGVNIIIALGHSGYTNDLEMAAKAPLVDLIVGAHSHSFLWSGPQPDTEVPEGPYPTIVTQASGRRVPVVQAYAYTKYLGHLNLTFDDDGELLKVVGQPILLDQSIPEDEDILRKLEIYRPAVDAVNSDTIGKAQVTLDGSNVRCRTEECNFGNLIADAFVLYRASEAADVWTDTPIGLMNGGGIRNMISGDGGGRVSRGDVLAVLPFGNSIDTLKLKGSDLVKTLELGIRSNGETSKGEFLQVSGLQVLYDRSKPVMSRVVSVKTRCGDCEIPRYTDIDLNKNYSIVLTDFLADGNDGHDVLKYKAFDRKHLDLGDADVLVWYFKKYSAVFAEVHGRISFVESKQNSAVLLTPSSIIFLFIIITYLSSVII